MPTINFYVKPDTKFSEVQMKALQAVKGQELVLKLKAGDVKDGKLNPSFNWQKEVFAWILKKTGASGVLEKLLKEKGKFDGRLTDIRSYDLFLTCNETRMKAMLDIEAPPAPKVLAEPKITYANSKVKNQCDAEVQKKLASVFHAGPKSSAHHGPVPFLDGALHVHVTNTHGVGYKWNGDTLHVVAYGKKNNQNKVQNGKKTCEYDWITK